MTGGLCIGYRDWGPAQKEMRIQGVAWGLSKVVRAKVVEVTCAKIKVWVEIW